LQQLRPHWVVAQPIVLWRVWTICDPLADSEGGYCCSVGLVYNQNMKRLALSVFGGFVIPFTYSVIAWTLSRYVKSETLNILAGYPVRWPSLILYRLGFPVGKGIPTLLYILGCNVLLYTLLTYCFLWAILKRKRKEFAPPPNPPFLQQ
jgi:hypothetical protein